MVDGSWSVGGGFVLRRSINQQNQQLSEENNNLTKEIREITKDKEALNERIIILEHAITAILVENNKLKMNDWKMVNHSRKRTRSDDAISVHKTEDIPTSNNKTNERSGIY